MNSARQRQSSYTRGQTADLARTFILSLSLLFPLSLLERWMEDVDSIVLDGRSILKRDKAISSTRKLQMRTLYSCAGYRTLGQSYSYPHSLFFLLFSFLFNLNIYLEFHWRENVLNPIFFSFFITAYKNALNSLSEKII